MPNFIIPGEAVPMGRPRFTKHGRVYTPSHCQKYKKYVQDMLVKQMLSIFGGMTEEVMACWDKGVPPPPSPFEGSEKAPVKVSLMFFQRIPESWAKRKRARAINSIIFPANRPDIDNLCKTILDACNGVLWHDDSQVVSLYASKLYGDAPRVEMEVEYL